MGEKMKGLREESKSGKSRGGKKEEKIEMKRIEGELLSTYIWFYAMAWFR